MRLLSIIASILFLAAIESGCVAAVADPQKTPTQAPFQKGSTAPQAPDIIIRGGGGGLLIPAPPDFNIKTYGAKCDGQNDDTQAMQAAIDAAEASSGGVVYVPSSSGYCEIRGNAITFGPQIGEWLVIVLDNSVMINSGSLAIPQRTAILGLRGTLYFNSTFFNTAQLLATGDFPVITMRGTGTGFYFDHVDFMITVGNPSSCPVLITDDGSGSPTIITFDHAHFFAYGTASPGGICAIPSAPGVITGYGLNVFNSHFEMLTHSLNLTNFGIVKVRGGQWNSGMAVLTAGQIPCMGDFTFEDIITEDASAPFLTVNSIGVGINDIYIHRIQIADPIGPRYLIRHNSSNNNSLSGVEVGSFAAGIDAVFDPASTPNHVRSVTSLNTAVPSPAMCSSLLVPNGDGHWFFSGSVSAPPGACSSSEYTVLVK